MIRKTIVILLLISQTTVLLAQSKPIKVEASRQPLNSLLIQLRDQYDFQFSFNDSELSKYKITVSKTFASKEETIRYLLTDLPFQLKKAGEVYIIIPVKKVSKAEKPKTSTLVTGQIVEAGSLEPLPFSHILINSHQMVSDVMGGFNYIASADSTFHVRISHLGYYVYDTILFSATNHRFTLIPSTEYLKEINVQNNIIEKSTLIGEISGKIKLNHAISRFLPGQGDNSVFNLLRLMPGIQAAGEQSTDLLIWGSYEGQSQITFDEFTVFGLKNYNDNISVVNPFLVKNIEIYKGGFEAKYGNRVGGIVNIAGKNGNMQKPSFSLNINPTTINGLVEWPLFKKSSLMLAYRQTYYNLYNSDDFNIFAPTRSTAKNPSVEMKAKNINFDIDVYPDNYQFRDLNLKYSIQSDNGGLFYISLYGGGDLFGMTASADLIRNTKGKNGMNRIVPFEINITNNETNKQNGLTTYYGKNWKNGSSTQFILSHSGYSKQITDEIESKNLDNNAIYNQDRSLISNEARENIFRVEQQIPLYNGSNLEFGGGIVANSALISSDTNLKDTLAINSENTYKNNRAYLFLQDNFKLGNNLSVKPGIRLNYHRGFNRYFFEPRLSSSFKINEFVKLNASWGVYNQFMYKIANVDRDNNYTYLWVTANDKIPALRGMHWIGGLNYFKNNFTVNVEGYFKTTNNISERRFESFLQNGKRINEYRLYQGNAKTYGIDTYVKKDFGRHSIWASYTLSKTLESLAPIGKPLPEYVLAPHDQRHEFKIAALFSLKNFYLSGNYVYGSGMEILREVFADETNNVSYNRFDAALTYHFQHKKFSGETGLSVLNVFDTQNLKYANLKNIFINQEIGAVKIYSDAVPFTPILFLKVVF